MDMNPNNQQNELRKLVEVENLQNDPLWDLISADAKTHPIAPSPWFVARTVAQARTITQGQRNTRALILRWLIPIPLAGLALVFLLFSQGVKLQNLKDFGKTAAYSYISTESEFEQRMDLLTSIE